MVSDTAAPRSIPETPLPSGHSAPDHPRRAVAMNIFLVCVLTGEPVTYAAGCQLQRVGELQVTMKGARPLVHAGVNGKDALFLADTGAFYSTLDSSGVTEFRLRTEPAPVYFAAEGVAGEAHTMITRVSAFTIFGTTIPNVDFFVVDKVAGADVAGILGQNVFRLGDMEIDLAHGVIRLLRPHECGKNDALAYWAATESKPYSVIDIDAQTRESTQVMGDAYVNGTKIRVIFDTGASRSVLTLAAARKVGITPTTDGVRAAGSFVGLGGRGGNEWIAPFASFKVGDEEIRNTHLRMGDLQLRNGDMLLGADFFLSHHVLVASSQRKLYFTYNGGPVFDLQPRAAAAPDAAKPTAGPGTAAPPPAQ